MLVDTGADRTYLTPGDGAVLGLDYSLLETRTQTTGVGGSALDFTEPAVLVFDDARRLYIYEFVLAIALPTTSNRTLPSLLGRDILDQWHMSYRPTVGHLRFSVQSASAVARTPAASEAREPIRPQTARR